MLFRQLFDAESATYTYLLADEVSKQALLIDPVRDQLERDSKLIAELGLELVYTLETHVHADHVTASGALRQRLGSRSVVGVGAGSQCADRQVRDGDEIELGNHSLRVLETPGHTNGCVSYYDAENGRVFTGDALLIRGCGRTDFQQGDSRKLYRSITEKLFTLPQSTEVWPGHDYQGRSASSIAEEQAFNPRLAGKTEEQFVEIMQRLELALPKKIAEAVPANMSCGMLPMTAEPTAEKGWAPIERTSGGVPEVTSAWLASHSNEIRCIDVREPSEFNDALGHVERSENVPLDGLKQSATHWDPEQPIVLVCRSGRRSGEAALQLEGLGFKRVASLRAGMIGFPRDLAAVSRAAS